MKKIVTLLITAAAFSSSFAQSNDIEEAKRIVLGERKDSRSTSPSSDPKDVVLGSDGRKVYDPRDTRYPTGTTSRSRTEQINREYDAKIRSIRNNPNLSAAEKERIIRDLNNERARRLRDVNGDNRKYEERRRYEDKRYDRRNDNDDDDKKYKNKKSKGNNGNHYGWQKGKGNPHKNK
jgi:hypothetical protein